MAKQKTQFICQNCGAVSTKWSGKCESCSAWNTIVEENPTAGIGGATNRILGKGRALKLVPLSGESEDAPRLECGIAELDRVTGGGFVPGSAILLGGDPGIGKSTILLQAAAMVARAGKSVIYISGEEAIAQVRMRARRLGLDDAPVQLAAETSVEDILATLQAGPPPAILILDSIQTLWTSRVESAPGTVTQVRTATQAMVAYAKKSGATVILVGHVTKDGQIAGPRVVEHMVDCVFHFEGEGSHKFRIMRANKNRFGPTDEIGVFEMTSEGLKEISNPSQLFLGERNENNPGTAVFAGMEGTRPVLVEIQALVAPSPLGTPRRAVVGWDSNRLAMVVAVLETHCGVRIGANDIYLNVAGGLRISEPAADLAVAAALVSSLTGNALPNESIYFGEIGLSGTIRTVPHTKLRLREAGKLGFKSATLAHYEDDSKEQESPLSLHKLKDLSSLVVDLASAGQS